MTERELGKALLKWDANATPQADPREPTRRLIARDRRRVRWMAALTIIFWLAAAGGIVTLIVSHCLLVAPKLKQMILETGRGKLPLEKAQNLEAFHQWVIAWGVVGVAACVGILALAALSSFILMFISRRATLRQVNANLAVIAEQLRALQKPDPA